MLLTYGFHIICSQEKLDIINGLKFVNKKKIEK